MKSENIRAVAKFIEERLAVCNYSLGEIALLTGVRNVEMLEDLTRGERRVPLDKVLPLADALGCDKRQLFVLVLRSWFDTEFVDAIKEAFADGSSSSTEQEWLGFLRGFYGGKVPELTPTLRRRLRLLVNLPS